MKVSKEIYDLYKKHDKEQIKMGIKIEREHNSGPTDVVDSNLDLLKITLAHLEEDPEYYTHLTDMEKQHVKEWILEEGTGLLTEAPHIEINDKVIDFEFEKDKVAGLKKIIKAIMRKEISDKYGNKFQLKSDKEVNEFIETIMKNPQIKRLIS